MKQVAISVYCGQSLLHHAPQSLERAKLNDELVCFPFMRNTTCAYGGFCRTMCQTQPETRRREEIYLDSECNYGEYILYCSLKQQRWNQTKIIIYHEITLQPNAKTQTKITPRPNNTIALFSGRLISLSGACWGVL